MANSSSSSSSSSRPKRKMSRETQFNRAEAAAKKERKQRAAAATSNSTSATTSTSSSSRSKPTSRKKTLTIDPLNHRHRYKSFNQRLSSLHIDVSRSKSTSTISGLEHNPSTSTSLAIPTLPEDSTEEELQLHSSLSQTNFGSALLVWRELNLSLGFQAFLKNVIGISGSLVMLLHHKDEILEAILQGLKLPSSNSNVEASSFYSSPSSLHLSYEPLLDLIPRLSQDLSNEFLPFYPQILSSILQLTEITKSDTGGNEVETAKIVEKAFESLARLFRELSGEILKDLSTSTSENDYLEETWRIIKPYLGYSEPKLPSPQTQSQSQDGNQFQSIELIEPSSSSSITPNLPSTTSSRPPKFSPHTLRFSSEALAHLVRKSPRSKLGKIASVMCRDLGKMLDLAQERKEESNEGGSRWDEKGYERKIGRMRRGIAGVWGEVVKSVDHRLHSQTSFLLSSLFECSPPSTSTSKNFLKARSQIVTLVLTSIVHHTSRPHLTFLIEEMCNRCGLKLSATEGLLDKGDGMDVDRDVESDQTLIDDLKDAVNWLGTLIGVRKGNRVDDSIKSSLFSLLRNLSTLQSKISSSSTKNDWTSISSSLTIFEALLIPIGRIQDLVGNGMKSLEILSSSKSSKQNSTSLSPSFSTLVLSLSNPSLNWSSFHQFAFPIVLTQTSRIISSLQDGDDAEGVKVLEFLNDLNKNGKFDGFKNDESNHSKVEEDERFGSGKLNQNERNWIRILGTYVLKGLKAMEERIQVSSKDQGVQLKFSRNDINLIELSTLFKNYASSKSDQHAGEGFSGFADPLRASIESLLDIIERDSSSKEKKSFESQGPLNNYFLLSSLVSSLNSMIYSCSSSSKSSKPSPSSLFYSSTSSTSNTLVSRVLSLASWHKPTLISLADLLETLSLKSISIPLPLPKPHEIVDSLTNAFMSGDGERRLSSLKVLKECESFHQKDGGLYEKVLEVEKIELSVEMIRDRNVRMRNLGREVERLSNLKSNSISEEEFKSSVNSVIKYLVGSFKLNFKPVWEESRKTLIDLSASIHWEKQVWDISFNEMLICGNENVGTNQENQIPEVEWNEVIRSLASKTNLNSGLDEDHEEEEEEDRSEQEEEEEVDPDAAKQFIDPQLSSRRKAIRSHLSAHLQKSEISLPFYEEVMDKQRFNERLDLINYEAQVLALYEKIPRTVEKNNKEFLEVFFERVPYRPEEDEDEEIEEEEEAEVEEDQEDSSKEDEEKEEEEIGSKQIAKPISKSSSTPKLSLLQRRSRLCSYLSVFSKFGNPKALSRSAELHSFLYELCSLGDAKVQKLALDCVLTWKNPSQTPYAERMKNLLDPSKFRDELTGFTLSSEADFEAGLGGGKPKGNKGGFKESNKEIKVQENDRQHLMPLVLRLFFGQMVSRRGKNTSGAGQAARKTAILIALVGCPGKELGTLVDLMLDAFDDQKPTFDSEGRFQLAKEAPKASTKRQIGFLSLLGDVLKHLGLVLVDYWPQLIGVTLNLTNYNQQKASQGKGSITQPARNIRQLGLKRLAEFFKKPIFFDWKPFLSIIFSEIVSPKLSLLRVESIQNPSALLDLIHTWSSKSDTIHLLVSGDKTLLPNLYACLNSTGVKPLVITRILDVVERALTVAEEEKQARGMGEEAEQENVLNSIVRPYVSSLLSNIGPLVHKTSSLSGAAAIASQKDILLKREISLLSAVAPFVTLSADASELLRILSPMVKKGNKVVNEKTKVDLLGIFRDLLLLTPEFRDSKSETFKIHYDLFSGLFASLRSRAARISLVEAFVQFKEIDGSLEKVTGWTKALNSFSTKRLEEYDFDKRLDAFDEINSEIENFHLKLTSTEWLPLLHNMIHFVQDEQELAIRSNAGTTLKRFVQAVSTSTSSDPESEETLAKKDLFLKVVYPGLRKALRSKSELVRREVLGVLAVSVETLGDVGALDEMRGLLADGDAEASFFNNIHHIQVHRRARALRRLGDEASKGVLKSKTISDVLAPLIGHFLNPENVELHDPNLVNETIACLGRLSKQLGWSNYNNLLWRYLRLANEKSAHEKVYVRASMSILDGFHFSMEEQAEVEVKKKRSEGDGDAEGEAKEDEEDEGDDEAVDSAEVAAAQEAKARSVKILDAVTGKLLPSLMNYLSQKDDTDDAVRLPIAVGVVKVAKCLPPAKREAHIHKLLNTLANVLKSKAQDTRDLGRETLWKVSLQLGPSYFPAMVKELRRSLTRGPQLAVLAFTVHALLVHMMTSAENALVALDQGIEDVVHVATEDIFGHTAEDRDDPGYKSKMREVRQSKSMDTFEQLSKIVVPHRMNSVLLPLRDIMQQTEILKAMKSIDDVLRRVAAGINANLHFDSSALLVLCHTLISRNAAFLQPRKQTGAKVGAKGGPLAGYKFAVLLKRKEVEAAQGAGRDHYARNAHRFVAFGLDLLVTALRRARFDFADNQVLAKIDPMVSAVGNTLYATEFGVLNLGLKATGGLLKCPVPSLPPSLPIFLKQIFAIIHRSGTAQSDITQTALKTLTSILRECKDADIKEKQLTELLALILPDLEEPIAQSTLFGLLRAIVTRRFVVPEVYDVMDKVAEMLVTNQSGQVRELCRATFLQFLLDYPQGKGRLKNQMAFLAKNLSYVYESGRLSVMDLISAIFSKFSDDVIREHSDLFFVALVMVLANDESSKCRETGSKLLRTLVGMLEENQLNKSIQMTHAWSGQTERQELSKVGMQVYGILLEGAPDFSSGWLPKASQNIGLALKDCADDLETLETSAEYGEDQMDLDVDWQLPYQALQALTKIHKVDASLVSEETWDSVRRLLLFPHKWVRIAASRLLGSLYSTSTPVAPSMTADIKDPLSFVALTDCAKKLSLQLRSSILDDNLSLQIVKNLLFIGKSLALIEVRSKQVEDLEQAVQENGAPGEEGEDPENEMDRDDEEDDSEDEEEQIEAAAKIDNSAGIVENPLAWLFSKLSHQARSSQLSRKPSGPETKWSIQPSSILRWFAAMSAHLEPSRVETFLPHIITPIHRIIDDETIKNPQMEELKTLATEVQDLIQERVGTSKFSTAYQIVRKRTQEKRRERKTNRLMQGIKNPEAAAKRKAYKNDAKHASRKRKNSGFADRKDRIKPLKRHRG